MKVEKLPRRNFFVYSFADVAVDLVYNRKHLYTHKSRVLSNIQKRREILTKALHHKGIKYVDRYTLLSLYRQIIIDILEKPLQKVFKENETIFYKNNRIRREDFPLSLDNLKMSKLISRLERFKTRFNYKVLFKASRIVMSDKNGTYYPHNFFINFKDYEKDTEYK